MPFDAAPITSPVIEALRGQESAMLLRRSRERLRTAGLCKGVLNEDGRYCAIGALRADGDRRAIEGAVTALYLALPWQWRWWRGVDQWTDLTPIEARIAAYTDAPRRTQAAVLVLYDKAIDIALGEAA